MEIQELIVKLESYAGAYEFSFQFWGEGNNNVFIEKDQIEVASFGGEESIHDILQLTYDWLKKHKATKEKVHHCQICGVPVAKGNDFCAECVCEDDSDI